MTPEMAAGLAAVEAYREEKLGEPYKVHKAQLAAWETARAVAAAELLDVDVDAVTPFMVGVAAGLCDRPDLLEGRPVYKPPSRKRRSK